MTGRSSTTTRRTFIGMGTMALSSAAAGTAHGQLRKRSAGDLLKIGLILGEWAHSTGWGKIMNGVVGDKTFPKRTGMYYTHVWHIKRDVAEEFAKRYGIGTVVKSFDAMVGKVDGVIIDTLFQTPWIYKLARPYLEAGIPVFSDRPFTDAVWKAKEVIELAKKYKTPFWSGSSLEQMYTTVEAIKHNPPESILGYETWSDGESDFYSHGLHGLWWTYRTTGGGIHAIAHRTEAWNKGGGTSTIIHKDRGKGQFLGKIIHKKREDCLIYTKFKGNDRIYRYDNNADWETFVYLPLLLKIQDIFYFGEKGLPETYDQFLEKCKLFIAGFRSILRENGDFVDLDSLDEDWSIGCPWGQTYMPGIDVYRAYTKLFGPEKGEIKPLL